MNIDLTDMALTRNSPGIEGRDTAEQLAQLEALYAAAPLGLGFLDGDLRFVRVNARLAEMNGYSVEAHLGRRAWDLLPDLRASAEPALRQVLGTGLPLRDIVVRGETPAHPGVVREWREHFYPVFGNDGVVQGIGIVCEEVTDRLAAEATLLRQLALLSRTSRRLLLDEGDEGATLEAIFIDIATLLSADGYFHYRPFAPGLLGLEIADGLSEDDREAVGVIKFGEFLCGRIAATRERIIIEDLQNSAQPGAELLKTAMRVFRSSPTPR